jgi:restriction endonuclease Mrr
LLRKLGRTPSFLHSISPRAFEKVIASLLEKEGFAVKITPQTRDGGRDILAWLDVPVGRILTLVECKKYAADRRVSVEPVRQLYGVLNAERATNAMLATTSTFTSDAKLFANALQYQMSLKDFDDLSSWLARYK